MNLGGILADLSLGLARDITPERSLLFLDEIHAAPPYLLWRLPEILGKLRR